MRVLFTTQPGTGHLRPMVPLAQALLAKGHEVAVACAESFVPQVEAAGLRPFVAGLDWLESEPEHAFPEMADMSPAEKDEAITDIFVDIAANYMTHDLLELCANWKPDLLVRDYSEYGACIVGELLGIPHAVVGLGLYLPDYITKMVMEKPLAYLRSAYGLPAQPAMEMLTKYLYLSLLPPSYQFPEYSLPSVTHALRPFADNPASAADLPAWVHQLPDQPTVYVSMGTVFNRVPDIFKTIIAGLENEPVNVIITVGRNQDPALFGPTAVNIHIEQFIPQHALMPYCNAVVTHGGINTILTGLSYGLPLVVIPLVGHQLQNVTRCKALQAGIPLMTELLAVDPSQIGLNDPQSAALGLFGEAAATFSPQSVRQAVHSLLNNPVYRQSAQAIQAEMAALRPLEDGVALLEQLAASKQPIHNLSGVTHS